MHFRRSFLPLLVHALDAVHWHTSAILLGILKRLFPSVASLPSPDTVVVIRNCFFGDFVVAVPALRKLRQAFPRARIVFLTATSFAPGWKDKPQDDGVFHIEPGLIDDVVRYTSEDLRTTTARSALVERLACTGNVLSVAICYSADSLLSRLKRIVLCRALGLTFPLGLTGARTLPAQHRLNRWRLARTDIAHQQAAATACVDEALRQLGWSINAPAESTNVRALRRPSHVIGVAPFTKQFVKQWPLERFAEAMKVLSDTLDVRFEVYGASEETVQAATLDSLLADNVQRTSLCGQLSPKQLREHIENVDLLLCLDSGSAHIASLVDTPVVAVFSQITLHAFWKPWGTRGSLISVDVPCAACDTRTGRCPIGTKACIDGVQAGDVVKQVLATLNARDSA